MNGPTTIPVTKTISGPRITESNVMNQTKVIPYAETIIEPTSYAETIPETGYTEGNEGLV